MARQTIDLTSAWVDPGSGVRQVWMWPSPPARVDTALCPPGAARWLLSLQLEGDGDIALYFAADASGIDADPPYDSLSRAWEAGGTARIEVVSSTGTPTTVDLAAADRFGGSSNNEPYFWVTGAAALYNAVRWAAPSRIALILDDGALAETAGNAQAVGLAVSLGRPRALQPPPRPLGAALSLGRPRALAKARANPVGLEVSLGRPRALQSPPRDLGVAVSLGKPRAIAQARPKPLGVAVSLGGPTAVDDLRLGQLDLGGYTETDFAALFERSRADTAGDEQVLWVAGARVPGGETADPVLDGEVGIGAQDVPVDRFIWRIGGSNEDTLLMQKPVANTAISLNEYYDTTGPGADLRMFVLTDDGQASADVADIFGGSSHPGSGAHYVNWGVDTSKPLPADMIALFDGIAEGDRFVVAFARVPKAVPNALPVALSLGKPYAGGGPVPNPLSAALSLGRPRALDKARAKPVAAAVSLAAPRALAKARPNPVGLDVTLGAPRVDALARPKPLGVEVSLGQPATESGPLPRPLGVALSLGRPEVRIGTLPRPLGVEVSLGRPRAIAKARPNPVGLEVTLGRPYAGGGASPNPLGVALSLGRPAVPAKARAKPLTVTVGLRSPRGPAALLPPTPRPFGVAVSLGRPRGPVSGTAPERPPATSAEARWKRAARALAPARALLWGLEITHPDVPAPVRIVSDTRDRTAEGETWIALRFGARLAADAPDRAPRAELWVDNIGSVVTDWVTAAGGGAGARARVVQMSADGDDTEIEWEQTMRVESMTVDRTRVTARLGPPRAQGRAAVTARHDPARSPGLF